MAVKNKVNAAIIGTGYVGLSTAAAFASKGIRAVCVDVIREKVDMINRGKSPIFEKGMKPLLEAAVKKKLLSATTDIDAAVSDTDISFICVQTPSLPSGEIDLKYVKNAAAGIGKSLRDTGYRAVVVKSTVLPGTTENVVLPALENNSGKNLGSEFGLGMCPEFLREGCAVVDSLHPDRIIIGTNDRKSRDLIYGIYRRFDAPVLDVGIRTAEMIKYASNTFLAAKISLSNEIANICELYGIDVYDVMKGVGMDNRIGAQFLNAGAGFGGSCFPKDAKAVAYAARKLKYEPLIINALLEINERQAAHVVDLVQRAVGSLRDKRVALLGLAFKPETDDVRETRAVPIALGLLGRGAIVVAYDPRAMNNFSKESKLKGLRYADCAESALRDADCCVIQADWDEFRKIRPETFRKLMKRPIVVDGRRTFDPDKLTRAGVEYLGVGWKGNR